MAITQNTLIGRSQNKVGGTVFSTWKGKNVLKSKPLTVANPKTDAQLAQRSKLTQLVAYFRFALMTIRASFTEVSAGSTEWASFLKYNLKHAFSVFGPTATFIADQLILSRGTLINAIDMALTAHSVNSVDIEWTDNSGSPGANASDVLKVAVVDITGNVRISTSSTNRSSGSFTFAFDTAMPTTAYAVYVWFVNTSMRKASDSFMIADFTL